MITRAQFAALALALPEATQASHFGKPDFRVRNKIFAGLDGEGARGSLKVRTEIQQLLIARPQAYVPAAGAWGEHGWTMVMLDHVELDEVRELMADAWRQVAPARLAAQQSAGQWAIEVTAVTSVESPSAVRRKRSAPKATPGKKKKRSKKKRQRRSAQRRRAPRSRRVRGARDEGHCW